MSKKLLFALALLLPTVTFADTDNTRRTGDALIDSCKALALDGDSTSVLAAFKAGICYGYLEGFSWFLVQDGNISIPSNVTNKQAALVIIKYGDDHPERLHEDALTFYLQAMEHAWPAAKH
jgi:hypothetical protein